MTWDDSEMHGEKGDIREALEDIRSTIDPAVRKRGPWRRALNLNSRTFQDDINTVRRFIENLKACGDITTDEGRRLYKEVRNAVNWSAHDKEDDDKRHNHTDVTPDAMWQMVSDLRQLVAECEVLAEADDEDSDDSDSYGDEVCTFYLQRRCKHGARGYGCNYLHPCRYYYLDGYCNQGDNCDWRHVSA